MKLSEFSLLAGLALSMVSTAVVAAEAKPAPLQPQVSEQEFQLERGAMKDDLARKIDVLKSAHACADAAKTVEALGECNQKLYDAIKGAAPKAAAEPAAAEAPKKK